LQFSSKDEYRYHEALVHPGLAALPQARRVLILGGGDGMAVREALRYPQVDSILLVDLDERVTQLFRTQPILRRLNADAFLSGPTPSSSISSLLTCPTPPTSRWASSTRLAFTAKWPGPLRRKAAWWCKAPRHTWPAEPIGVWKPPCGLLGCTPCLITHLCPRLASGATFWPGTAPPRPPLACRPACAISPRRSLPKCARSRPIWQPCR
jgi:hypothetical protein